MAATIPYADYEYYTDEYKGSLLTEDTFPQHARWASHLVNSLTYGNIKSDDLVSDCVKDAVCAAAELAYNFHRSTISSDTGRGTQSESNDGYSITYSGELSSTQSLIDEASAMIRVYLMNSGLLFRGIGRRRKYG